MQASADGRLLPFRSVHFTEHTANHLMARTSESANALNFPGFPSTSVAWRNVNERAVKETTTKGKD